MLNKPTKARIAGVSYYLPENQLTNQMISDEFPEWSVEKIAGKTGIHSRHVAGNDEFSSTLATGAARALASKLGMDVLDVDYIILCTQTPDFFLPTTACLVQQELGLPSSVGAIDVNQGCSGYVYSVGLAKGVIESGQAKNVLVLTADTYTKLTNPSDKSVRTIFGDAASATLISASESDTEFLSGFVYGTDGSGAPHLMTTAGNLRGAETLSVKGLASERDLEPSSFDLYMNGPEIFNFTLRVVPELVQSVLTSAGVSEEQVDLFVPHQANTFMLTHLREKLGIPPEKFPIEMADIGNTVSSTIPITLARLHETGRILEGQRIMILGFGVGLSWAGAMIDWSA